MVHIQNIKKGIKSLIFQIEKVLNKEFCRYDHFPFNSMQPLNPSSAEDALKKVSEYLKVHQIQYRLTDGTVLGLYRNHAFIPHDNDIDIDILDCNDIKGLIKSIQKNLGYKIGCMVVYKGKIQQVAFYNLNEIIIDLGFWYSNGDNIYNYEARAFVRIQKTKYFKKLDTLLFNSTSYPIPGSIEEWLNFRYGSDWRQPKTYKGDWKDDCGDLKKL